jgi:drug/metabolite transporter (DMT)-like permease
VKSADLDAVVPTSSRVWRRLVTTGYLPEIMLLVVAAVWGSSYAVTKQVTLQITVLQYLVLRFGLTALLLSPALVALLRLHNWRKSLSIGVSLGFLLLCIFLCETWGVTFTTATNAAFLISLCVAFTPLAEWAILGQEPTRKVQLAALTCVTGAFFLSPSVLTEPLASLGDWLLLVAALLRACMVTLTRRMTNWHSVPALSLTAIQSWVVFLGALAVLIVCNRGAAIPPLPKGSELWLQLGFLVLLCTIFAFFAQNYAASRSSPTRVAFLMGSEPVFGALFAWLLFGEMLSGSAWIGCGLILIGTVSVVNRQIVFRSKEN